MMPIFLAGVVTGVGLLLALVRAVRESPAEQQRRYQEGGARE